MKLIFICKHNVFRSRVAEEYFKKTNKDPKIKVISRGLIMGGQSDPAQREIAKKLLGIKIEGRKPVPLTLPELIGADLVIVVANDIPSVVFDYQRITIEKKVVIWNIKDEQLQNKENIKRTILSIKEKVDQLNKKLEKKR